jgi:NADH-quinone oxidoreductase subunit J
MSIEGAVFWGSALSAGASALMVVSSRHPVRAVLFLILSFISTAVTWLLLEAEFLAISLIVVYVGAVMVLFLFVVMMLDIALEPLKQTVSRYLPLGILAAASLIGFLVWALVLPALEGSAFPALVHQPLNYSNIKALGEALYTDYIFAFELAGVILLVAMVAAILLAFRGTRNAHKQIVGQQVKVRKEDRITLVDLNLRPKPDVST